MSVRFATPKDIIHYFKDLKEWNIPLDYAFDFYLPYGCDYDKFSSYGILSFKDFNDERKFISFINSYVTDNFEEIAETLKHVYIFHKHNIVYKRTYTDDKGITSPILVDVLHSDRLDRVPMDAIYYFAIEKFGRPPNNGETRLQQQERLRQELAEHKDLEGLFVIQEIQGYTF
jgi:hypothetical protein